MNKVLVVKDFSLPKKSGVHYRLLCLTGSQKGESFFLSDERIIVGRGDKADIKIMDANSSREHAELKKIKDEYVISDLGSQNGVIVNDLKVHQQALKDNDKIVIGKTVFKYNIIFVDEKKVDNINLPSDNALDSGLNIKKNGVVAENKDVKSGGSRKRLYLIVAAILGGFFLIPDPEQDKVATTGAANSSSKKIERAEDMQEEVESLMAKKQEAQDREMDKKLNEIFLRGLREEREGNYFRAINEYNLALTLAPGNARALFYRKRTMDNLDLEVKAHFDSSARLRNALHLRGAITENCAVVRLLQYAPEDENYKHAIDNIRSLEKELGLDENAINCL